MAACIIDLPTITSTLMHPKHNSLPITSPKQLSWKCIQCSGIWRESVAQRVQFTLCPECEPNSTRKVTPTIVECPICYTSTRSSKCASCPSCSYRVCRDCLKAHILSGVGFARCINQRGGCETNLPTTYLTSTFGKKWVRKTYRTFLTTIHMERERGLLQSTQQLIPLYRQLDKKTKEFHRAGNWLEKNSYSNNASKYNAKLRHYEELDRTIIELSDSITHFVMVEDGHEEMSSTMRTTYIQGCPTEGCNGLINKNFSCDVCDVHLCNECRVVLNDNKHSCNANDIATVKSLVVNTKPCPKCAVPVYKIDGCDQMWCIVCKVAFSWINGRIETGKIHNPHYYDWLREKNRAEGGNGTIPRDIGDINDDHQRIHRDAGSVLMYAIGLEKTYLIRKARAIAQVERAHGERDIETLLLHKLRTLRVYYLIGHISMERWIKKIPLLYRKLEMLRHKERIYREMSIILMDITCDFEHEAVSVFTSICDEKTLLIRSMYEKTIDRLNDVRSQFNSIIIAENADMSPTQFTIYDNQWEECKYSDYDENFSHYLLPYPPLPSEEYTEEEGVCNGECGGACGGDVCHFT